VSEIRESQLSTCADVQLKETGTAKLTRFVSPNNSTFDSAVVIKIPNELMTQVLELGAKYNPTKSTGSENWIKLIYPFVEIERFLDFKGKFGKELSEVAPFQVTLNKLTLTPVEGFNLSSVSTKPTTGPGGADCLKKLQQSLLKHIPLQKDVIVDKNIRLDIGFATESQLPELKHIQMEPISWEVREIFLVYRERETGAQFQDIQSVHLSGVKKVKEDQLPSEKKKFKCDLIKYRFAFNPNQHFGTIIKRVNKWIATNHKSLPKTPEGLSKSITLFCQIKCQVLSPEYILEKLIIENFLEVDDDDDLIIVDRPFLGFPQKEINGKPHYTHILADVQIKALTKAFLWLSSVQKPANTRDSFMKVMNQFCFTNMQVDPQLIVTILTQKKLISIHPSTFKITYNTRPTVAKTNCSQKLVVQTVTIET